MRTLKIGVGRFLYGKGTVKQLPEEIVRYGKSAFLVGGKTTLPLVMNQIKDRMSSLDIQTYEHTLIEHNSVKLAKDLALMAKSMGSDVVVSIGGGKCMDVCKLFSDFAKLPIITVPTSVATCAACSAVSILYTPKEGRYDCSIPKEEEVNSVIADTSILLSAPKRLLAAGIMDTLAKLPEIINGPDNLNYSDIGLKKYMAFYNSKFVYNFLIQYGLDVYQNPEKHFEKFEDIVLINLLITSMISGFSSGTDQLAIAHGLYNASRLLFPIETKDALHGEIVGLGLILQMELNDASDETRADLMKMIRGMRIPSKLSEIGIIPTKEKIDAIIDYNVKFNNLTDYEKQKLENAFPLIL